MEVVSRISRPIDFELREMNLRHAAALALVGWYLITPPFGIRIPGHYANSAAPLAKWRFYNELHRRTPNRLDKARAKEFDSKAACEAKRAELYPTLSVQGATVKERIEINRELGSQTICIATDDPRLKEK
jgi:hypothetical protein